MRYHVKSVEKVNLASITSYCAKQGKGLLNCPWPSVTVKLHGRENPMNTHLLMEELCTSYKIMLVPLYAAQNKPSQILTSVHMKAIEKRVITSILNYNCFLKIQIKC